jgi:hypothetical protein
MVLDFIGKGTGSTKSETIIVGTTTMAEAFGVGDEIYVHWVLPAGVNRIIAPTIEGSFFPLVSEVATTVSWQVDFIADVHGGIVGGPAVVRYIVDAPLPETAYEALHGTMEFPNSGFLTVDTDAVHIRVKRIASSNDPTSKVAIDHLEVHFATEGKVGAPGADGADGADGGTLLQYAATAGENIGVYKLVRVAAGTVYLADKDNVAYVNDTLGLTMSVSTTGNPVDIQVGGEMTNVGWAWTAGSVFMGDSGELTQTPPTVGILQKIGTVLTPTSILIDIDDPILRA